MTTITLQAYQATTSGTYNVDTQDYDFVTTGLQTVDLEFVLAGMQSTFSHFRDEYSANSVLLAGDGNDLDAYEARVEGDPVSLEYFYADLTEVQWGGNKSSDTMVISFLDSNPAFEEGDAIEETFYVIKLGGDDFTWNSPAGVDAWIDGINKDADGEEQVFDLTSGTFATNQPIDFADIADYVGSTENDTVHADTSLFTTFDLGVGNDTFYGSDQNERVTTGKGNDFVELGAGNDYVRVGGGQEEFYGGSGKDYISYYDSTNGITANLSTNEVSGSWAVNDIVEDFESISGSKNGDDSIIGTSGSNTIKTYGGDDRVAAGKGTDRVELGSGNDYVRVGGGKETFDGGSGTDYISYYSSANGIRIDLRDDEVSGSWAVNDTIKDFESASGSKTGDDTMLGTNGANTLRSYGGDDKLYGRSGSDKLYGGDGEDFLDGGGGSGTDLLYGGADADIFEFDRGEGVDIIKDFENNIDTINLDNFGFTKEEAFGFADQVGSDVVFDFGSDGMLTIEDVTIGQLQNDVDIV